jgi:nitrous oxidase accessory protein
MRTRTEFLTAFVLVAALSRCADAQRAPTPAPTPAAAPRLALAAAPETLVVAPGGTRASNLAARPFARIADAVAAAPRYAVIRVTAGVYREPTIIVRTPLTLLGERGAILDGEGQRELLVIGADSVTVRGMTFRNTGTSQATDRAALRVVEAAGCLIDGNRFERTLFGIYLQKASACLVRRNVLIGLEGSQTVTGNGLHSWASRDIVLEDNVIRGHRDGIYFEFTVNGTARRNVSEGSRRYGLHFMFSDSCLYEANTFRNNESGVAVMYSKHVSITGNRFDRSRGSAAYGLLLKDISDSEIRRNAFVENSIGLHLEGSSRNAIADNDFVRNGWAVRVLADAQDNVLTGNSFAGNVFDVGTNSRRNYSTFEGNWWERYRGYDLDRDGRGDVAHAPVRLFALLVEQSPAALVLVRSLLVDVLDVAERVMPTLTPETLRDAAPLMRAPRILP